MDRLSRIKTLINDRFGGSQAEFAAAVGRSPALVWQYLSEHRKIGEKFARHVERSLGLPVLWLDTAHIENSELSADTENMPPVDVIRRENLKRLASEYTSVANLAKVLGRSSSQVSQWINANKDSKTGKPRTISSASARMIETACGKPQGWMDHLPMPPDNRSDMEAWVSTGDAFPPMSQPQREALHELLLIVDWDVQGLLSTIKSLKGLLK